jgi:hypothetical protein
MLVNKDCKKKNKKKKKECIKQFRKISILGKPQLLCTMRLPGLLVLLVTPALISSQYC